MSRTLAIAGKGGVGKTTIAVNLAVSLSNLGVSVVMVDTNTASPSVGWQLGASQLQYSIQDALRGEIPVSMTTYQHPSGICIVPASISLHQVNTNLSRLPELIQDLRERAQVIILDTPGGLTKETQEILKHADEVLMVSTPDLPALVDALRIRRSHAVVRGAVLNRIRGSPGDLSAANAASFLQTSVLCSVPEDPAISESVRAAQPAVFSHPESAAGKKISSLAAKYLHG